MPTTSTDLWIYAECPLLGCQTVHTLTRESFSSERPLALCGFGVTNCDGSVTTVARPTERYDCRACAQRQQEAMA